MCVKTQTLISEKLKLEKYLSVKLEAEHAVKHDAVASQFIVGNQQHLPACKKSKLFVGAQ